MHRGQADDTERKSTTGKLGDDMINKDDETLVHERTDSGVVRVSVRFFQDSLLRGFYVFL